MLAGLLKLAFKPSGCVSEIASYGLPQARQSSIPPPDREALTQHPHPPPMLETRDHRCDRLIPVGGPLANSQILATMSAMGSHPIPTQRCGRLANRAARPLDVPFRSRIISFAS